MQLARDVRLGHGRLPGALTHQGRRAPSLLRMRPRFGRIYAREDFKEGPEGDHPTAPASIFNSGKDPNRFLVDTSDEESNLPDNPVGLDEEIIIPQRPGIQDIYRDVRHEWAEHHATGQEKFVADSSDEESNLPDDPLDLDEEMMVPQKTIVKEIYKGLPHGHTSSHQSSSQPSGKTESPGPSAATGFPPSDPNASSVASLNSEDIEVADELTSMFRFEGAGQAARELKEEHDREHSHSDHIVSGLPPPDPNASSVASLNSEDIEIADELAASFRFEGAGERARELKQEHDRYEKGESGGKNGRKEEDPQNRLASEESAPIPGSYENPQAPPPQHGQGEQRMTQEEQKATEMDPQRPPHAQVHPRPQPDLPGLIQQDTTWINPDAQKYDFAESDSAEREARYQGILEGIDKIRDEEIRRGESYTTSSTPLDVNPASDTTKAQQTTSDTPQAANTAQDYSNLSSALESTPATEESYTGLEGGIEDQINHINPTPVGGTDSKDVYWFVGDEEESGQGSGSDSDLGKLEFSFKSEDKNDSDSSNDLSNTDSKGRTAEVLRNVAAKAAAAGREMDPVNRLTAARQAYRDHRTLTEEALQQSKPHVTVARVAEVSAGRAAIVGMASAVASEVLLGQSVLSQLLGRWEGPVQVEFIVPEARSAVLAVLALSVAVTAIETIIAGQAPPSFRALGLSRGVQLWGGRLAMGAFLVILVYETMHSNRPVFPFWYILH